MAPALHSAKSEQQAPLRVACIGGGLAGLAFALAAHRRSIRVDVFERNKEIGEIGAGLSMQVNASIMVNVPLGLEKEYQGISNDMQPGGPFIQYRGYSDGRDLAILPVPTDVRPEDLPRYVIRSELLDILKQDVPQDQIHCAKALQKITRPASGDQPYLLHFTDGSIVESDVVVGADGIHSKLRATLQQWLDLEPDKAVFSGKAVYRGLLKRDEIPKESWDAMMRPDAAASTYRGPKKHIMTYPIGRTTDERPGKLLNLVVYVPDPDYDGSDSWTARGLVSDLEKEMDMFAEPVKAAIAALKVQSDTCWKQMLHYRSAIETWTDGRGLIIIGDAAQYVSPLGSRVVSQNDTSQSKSVAERSDRSAIPPHLGQGAAMALEDAVALATLLDGADHQNVVRRLEAAATLRQPRTTALLEASIKMGRVLDSQQADTLPKSDEAQMKTRQWIWSYRADLEAQKVLDQLREQERIATGIASMPALP